MVVERPNVDGTWPSTPKLASKPPEPRVKGHHQKRAGSWKKGAREEE